MAETQIVFSQGKGKQLEVTLTMRGDAKALVTALVSGLPRPVLGKLAAAFEQESKRRQRAAKKKR